MQEILNDDDDVRVDDLMMSKVLVFRVPLNEYVYKALEEYK
jgi:hypothetical protein